MNPSPGLSIITYLTGVRDATNGLSCFASGGGTDIMVGSGLGGTMGKGMMNFGGSGVKILGGALDLWMYMSALSNSGSGGEGDFKSFLSAILRTGGFSGSGSGACDVTKSADLIGNVWVVSKPFGSGFWSGEVATDNCMSPRNSATTKNWGMEGILSGSLRFLPVYVIWCVVVELIVQCGFMYLSALFGPKKKA